MIIIYQDIPVPIPSPNIEIATLDSQPPNLVLNLRWNRLPSAWFHMSDISDVSNTAGNAQYLTVIRY